jgi:hypothetical protein
MTLGRMVNFFLPDKKLCRISARRFGVIFICLDILAFLVQLAGAVLSSSTGDSMKMVMLGVHLYMGGIGLQDLFILFFLALTVHLHRKLLQLETNGTEGDIQKLKHCAYPWRWQFYTIYLALGLITVCQNHCYYEPLLIMMNRSVLFSALPNMHKAHRPATKSSPTKYTSTYLMQCLCS